MANVRISDVVQPFNGEGDVTQWLDKLYLVAKLRKIENVETVLPLFLEGPAFAVYSEMKEEDKKDLTSIGAILKEAFGLNGFLAYEELTSRSWRTGEPVDVYLAELRRLAKLAGVETDAILKRAFVVGLPTAASREMRSMANVETASLATMLNRARALMAESVGESAAAFAAAPRFMKPKHQVDAAGNRSRRCHRCAGAHLLKDCPSTERLRCWTCGADNHLSRNCQHQGNSSGRASAPEVLPKTH
jgi:hypothetical protein